MNRNDNAETTGEISQRRAWAWRMGVLWSFALVVRVLYIRTVDNSSIGSWGDQGGDIALNLLEGRGYVTSYGFIRDLQSFRVPVLPLTLYALWSLFGLNFLIPKLAMAVVSAFTCVLLALLGRRLFNERAGLWTGIAAAVCTSLIRWTGTLGAETLATFFLVAGVWLLCDPPARFAPTFRFTPAAICLALLALTRPVFLPYALLAASIIALARRDGARINKRAAVAFLAVFALVMAPWIARNAMIHHALIVSSTEGGLNFLESNNPESFRGAGDWIPHYSLSMPQVKKMASQMPEAALDRAMYRMAFGNIGREPSRFARVYVLRLRALWQPVPHLHGDLSPKHIAFLNLWWISFYLLALGAVTKLQLWRQHEHQLVLMALVWASVALPLFSTQLRYRAPLEPIVILYAAAGLDLFWRRLAREKFAERKKRELIFPSSLD